MTNVSFAIFALFFAFWFYSIFSIFSSKFIDEKQKVFWRIGIIFIPFLAFFYVFMKKNLLR